MVAETSFRSDETFTQEGFRLWLEDLSPSDMHHYELIRGRIVMSPPAGGWHGFLEAELIGRLQEHVKPDRLGLVFGSSTGFELPSGDTLQPDVAFVSRARWGVASQPVGKGFPLIVPTLVVEVLSPSTARRDRTEKLEIYAENGVEEYWLVDPRRREIEVLHRQGGSFGPPVKVSAGKIPCAVLPRLEIRIEDVFAELG